MTIFIENHPCHYEVQALCMMFFPGEKMTLEQGPPGSFFGRYLYTGAQERAGRLKLWVRGDFGGGECRDSVEIPLPPGENEKKTQCERAFGRMLYPLLQEASGVAPPWGILTGVRPVKLVNGLLDRGEGERAAAAFLRETMLVSGEKAALALKTAQVQRPVRQRFNREDYSLYLSIPFCPTRCRYCSFVSHSIERANTLIAPYLKKLKEEIALLGALMRPFPARLRTIYIGGGTPTTLSAGELYELFCALRESFDFSYLEEYTLEAGRPDTVDGEKLAVMRAAGVTRVSINPQTFEDTVLESIGRRHTADETLESFALAKEAGFFAINMDLIAGLPGDTAAGFARTVKRTLALRPENITVHALTVKRSAEYALEKSKTLRQSAPVCDMLTLADRRLMDAGYRPYYLYRQKNTIESLENTGFSLPGYESLYNTLIMDESHTILALGAGGVNKLVNPPKITRIFHFKYPYEYISRFEELAERKKNIHHFFQNLFTVP